MKQCSYCKEHKEDKDFYRNKRLLDGLNSRCKACDLIKKRQHAAKPKVKPEQKTCAKCNQTKLPSEFSTDNTTRDGLKSGCNECKNKERGPRKTRDHEPKPSTKICGSCREDKGIENFHKNKYQRFGLQDTCKQCTRTQNRARGEAKRSNHSGVKICESCKEEKLVINFHISDQYDGYKKACKSCELEMFKSRQPKEGTKLCNQCNQEVNVKQFSTDMTKDGLSNICKRCNTTRIREWFEFAKIENPKIVSHYNAKRKALKLNATPPWTDLQAVENIYANCPEDYEVDHIIPLQGDLVCGLHCEDNLQYLTLEENRRKSNQLIEEHLTINNSDEELTSMEND